MLLWLIVAGVMALGPVIRSYIGIYDWFKGKTIDTSNFVTRAELAAVKAERDVQIAATIAEIIATLKEQFSVTSVVVSHDRDLAFAIADRIAVLHQGRLIAVQTPAELRENRDPIIREFLQPAINLQEPRFKKLEANHD